VTARGFWSSASLTLRSLLWTLLLPGAVAGYLPWRFFGLDRAAFRLAGPVDVIGFLCIDSYEQYTRRVGRWVPRLPG
jgi:hypothetical protein